MNSSLLLAINGLAGHSKLLDTFMVYSAKYLIFVVFAVVAICLGLYIYNKEWKPAIYVFISLVVTFILLQLAGLLNLDHRPFMDHHLTQLVAHASGKSFPSDHTTASIGMALSLLYFTKYKKTGVLVLLVALLIGFARVFVGVHYPLDILGGIVTGFVGTTAVYGAMRIREGKNKSGKMQFSSH